MQRKNSEPQIGTDENDEIGHMISVDDTQSIK
jgi:hypothetical protein